MVTVRTVLSLALALAFCGCGEAPAKKPDEEKQGIIRKTTQDIGKFDPNVQDQVVGDQKINATDPLSAPLSAYGPTVENIAKTAIKVELETFNATEGRYPKDYDEFMEKIIKARNIQLPVLPYKGRYMYDEANRELVVVRTAEFAKKSGQVLPDAAPTDSEKAN